MEFPSLKWRALKGNSSTNCSEISEMNVTRGLQAHSRNLSSSSRPSQDPGGSLLVHGSKYNIVFFVYFVHRGEMAYLYFLHLLAKRAQGFASEASTGDFCHPCVKNQLRVVATLTNLPSVKLLLQTCFKLALHRLLPDGNSKFLRGTLLFLLTAILVPEHAPSLWQVTWSFQSIFPKTFIYFLQFAWQNSVFEY